jgi:glycosyltransferase involved in cell wall biosynthesis
MNILVVNNIYPPIMAGGAELMVAWLSEGLVARGHRVTVVSTCGPDMVPYPVETQNGVTVIRFFPPNLYWNFDRQGQKPYRRMLWHLRDAWNTAAGKAFQSILHDATPDVVHTHLIDGFSAAIWRSARRAGVAVPTGLPADEGLAPLPASERWLPALSRLASAHNPIR